MATAAASRLSLLAKAVATAGGAGYAPVAPGTVGTLVTLPIAWLAASWPLWGYVLLALTVTVGGAIAAGAADQSWGTHDNGRIVIDEVAGYLWTVVAVPRDRWLALVVGFALFRLLDILKPPPMNWIDARVGGGWGVMLDDVAAGVIGAVALGIGWRLLAK